MFLYFLVLLRLFGGYISLVFSENASLNVVLLFLKNIQTFTLELQAGKPAKLNEP